MRKGSIEVSIGFLIVMIIAALTMIFIMGWMGQLFPTLQDIGDYATSNARTQMMEEFGKGAATILATVPNNKDFAPGSNVKFLIGVKKQASVDDKDYFNFCIATLSSTDGCEPDTGTLVAAYDSDDTNNVDISGIKFSFKPDIKLTNRGESDTVEAEMQIPGTVETDTYGYVIYVCAKEGPPSASVCGETGAENEVHNKPCYCKGDGDPDYYGMYDFQMTVK
ncbi:MAG: hypothetical protein V1813_00185 [Candidatus Aenigmatarchaeota archaeon]